MMMFGPGIVTTLTVHHPRPQPKFSGDNVRLFSAIGYQINTDFIYSILGGGYYYTGTNVCPEGAYCRYFSDCEFRFSVHLIQDLSHSFFFQGIRNATLTANSSRFLLVR